jgi:uncharacterized membrane protein
LFSLFFAIYEQEKNSKLAYFTFLLPIFLAYFNNIKESISFSRNNLLRVKIMLKPFLREIFYVNSSLDTTFDSA